MPAAGELSLLWLVGGAGAAAAISIASVRARLLTRDGGVAQFVLGWLLITLGGLPWVIPIVTFFLSSSLLSRWSAARRPDVHALFSKGAVRDHRQVIANGGLAGVLVVIAFADPRPVWFAAYAGVCAAAAADTWGTEIGVLSSRDPRLFPTMKPVPPGTSGAVTLLGTAGGVLGAGLVSVVSSLVTPHVNPLQTIFSGLSGGIAGAFVDSLAGSRIQGRFRCEACGTRMERPTHCGRPASLVGGIRWVDNDTVNIVCTLCGALIAGALSVVLDRP